MNTPERTTFEPHDELEPPPQLIDGMTGLLDLGATPPTNIGRVYTYLQAASSTYTEHWVLQPAHAGWFTSANATTRLTFASPQPNKVPWGQVAPNFSGWSHAAITYQYTSPPAGPPAFGANTFVFDVHSTNVAGGVQGRLFRTVDGTIRDRWILYPTYLAPAGATVTELTPVAGAPAALFQQALTAGGPSSTYVDVTYTVAVLP
ncbi:MAG: hypothetical protein ABMA64_27085 [Myxococcota bacterium]